MLPPQTTYPTPQQVSSPATPPPVHTQEQVGPQFNEQFIEVLAQRLMPRLMPEIMYQVRTVMPSTARNRAFGMSLALAIVSLALMIPLLAIVLTQLASFGVAAMLIGLGITCLALVLVNIAFNILLFNTKS